MQLFYCDTVELPLPAGHRFPLSKYQLLREKVLREQLVPAENLRLSTPASKAQLELAHDPRYIRRVFSGDLSDKEIRRIGFPWSRGMVQRSRHSVGCTIGACRTALKEGLAAALAGGTHHAGPDWGQGFCVFNDVAVALRSLQATGHLQRAIVLDCDVHQGNGTAAIFADDPTVYTFSIHGEKNFPVHKVPSDCDVPLPDDTGDEAYLDALATHIPAALDAAAADLVVYICGADPYAGDRLGRLALTPAGLARRDHYILDTCLSRNLPVALCLGGGYAPNVHETVDIYYQSMAIATAHHRQRTGP